MADGGTDSRRSYNGICARLILRDIQGQLISKYVARAMLLNTYVSMRNGKYSYRCGSNAQGLNTGSRLGTAHGRSCLQHGKHTRHQ